MNDKVALDKLTSENIGRAVSEALNNWQVRRAEKGLPVATEAEKNRFTEAVLDSIHTTQERKEDLFNEKEDRAERKESLDIAAAELGVKFIHDRDFVEEEIYTTVRETSPGIFERKTVFRNVKSSTGGRTFAYRFDVSEDGDVEIHFSVAFCNTGGDLEKDEDGNLVDINGWSVDEEGFVIDEDMTEETPVRGGPIARTKPDTFDPLRGSEEALAKYDEGLIFVAKFGNGLTPGKLKLLASDYKKAFETTEVGFEEEDNFEGFPFSSL